MSSRPYRPTCNLCKETKELTEFHKKSKSPLGHSPTCKSCTSSRRKTYRVGIGDEMQIPEHVKKKTYENIILKMYSEGIASKDFCREALERIK